MSENAAVTTSTDDLDGKYLTFMIEDASYGIELLHVIEIISVQTVTMVPNLPDFIKGIINLRGKIVPVLDMRLKFRTQEKEYDEKTCIIVVTIDNASMGLIVDSVSDVATVSEETRSELPEFNTVNTTKYLSSIAKIGGRMILILDCERFLHDDVPMVRF